ncbi:hypothetical protein LGT39_00765 [Demequina sp. TTPB684]|uniref:hypothetical protein n=1 Tax=unclassified Demequina TaxID=2620311 RepID=UPI001CF1E706|nr:MULTISPECIES: hypothetical protein [unclassified Demequina]MCB2411376.1 hypothetical protein [Demequina sp. TTPB684]UPU89001.1 hypothetical protein LGT36_003505 [Demequina sp. TMPB413]
MTAFLDAVYPAVLVATAVLFVVAAITLAWVRAHRVLQWAVTGFYVVTLVEVLTLLTAIVSGDVPVVITIGYGLAAVALLPLLGIGRLGSPDADDPDPNRPVLQPDQIARVDAVAAMIIAVAAAVVAWRLAVIFEGAL